MKLCGIYLITHIETGRKYVGQSRDIHNRWRIHSRGHKKTKIGLSILKHGWQEFQTEVLELCSKETLNKAEMKWVAHFSCVAPSGFNLTSGGSLQTEYSAETRAKIGAANARRVVSDETRQKMSARVISAETRLKLSRAHSGKSISAEHAAALLAAAKKYAPSNIPRLAALNTGCKHTPEHIEKTRAAHIGSKRSAETCAKISAAVKGKLVGRKQTDEHRRNVSAALMGHKHSDQTKAKLSQAAKNRTTEHSAKITASKAANRLLRQNAAVTSV